MSKLQSFVRTVQDVILPDDTEWNYTIKNLPLPAKTNADGLVKSISLISSLSEQHIQLRFENAPSNRVTSADSLHLFLLLSFAKFRLRLPSLTQDRKVQFAPIKDSSDYIARLLKSGVTINGVRYHFYGHSNSQLRSRSCFMFAASKEEIAAKVEDMGDFSKLKSVGKKSKRIGLLFSSADVALQLQPNRCEDIDDITSGDYIFTDGCGKISTKLAKHLVQRRNIAFRNKRYLPSVFQIRYRGYKGVLTLTPDLKGNTLVQFRASMRKFSGATDLSLSVIDYSKPYAFGFLNDEVVLLLNALGITTTTLLSKQAQHLQFLQNAFNGVPRACFQFLSFVGQLDLAEQFLMDGSDAVLQRIQGLVKIEYSRMLNKYGNPRCRILVPESRLLFGVCDPSSKAHVKGKLKPGTCFVRITLDGGGEARTLVNTEVLVTRNPCLHPGDLQKFRAVDVPEFAYLVDCIVFPTTGKRPSADLMSGGDLDGDKFFVTWDPDIIPSSISEPARYPGVKEPISFGSITDDDRAEFFARYTNASLGRVKNLYLKWARLNGPLSPECQQLNRLFSQCVDGNRISVPRDLEDPQEPGHDCKPFVLDALHAAARDAIQRESDVHLTSLEYTVDAMDLLLSRDKIAISEHELVQQMLLWCNKNETSISEYIPFFDFNRLSDEQQHWLLASLPTSRDWPSMIKNGLLQSDLLDANELAKFKLDRHSLRWKPVFRSTTDRLGRFLDTASRSAELFHKKLIILRADERLTLAIYVPKQIPSASETDVNDGVRVFAFPQSQSPNSAGYKVVPTKVNSRLYCDSSTFQLYEGKRANTFVFITRGQTDQSSYQNTPSRGDRRRHKQQTINDGINFDCRASVALNKIGRGIQTHVGGMKRAGVFGAEIYVISNRDVQSMRLLDQWLHFIDTQEILPLFDQTRREYSVPSLKNSNLEGVDPAVVEYLRGTDSSCLHQMTVNQVSTTLHILQTFNERSRVAEVYDSFCNPDSIESILAGPLERSRCLLESLTGSPYLIHMFFKSQLWEANKDRLEDYLVRIGPELLRCLILSASSLQPYTRVPLVVLLQQLRQISWLTFAELIELVALTAEDPEAGLYVLLECLEREASRLLVGRLPAVERFTKGLIGIALDHIDEATNSKKSSGESLRLVPDGCNEGYEAVKAIIRIDSQQQRLRAGDHVRLNVANRAENAPFVKPYSISAVVIRAELGEAGFRCLQKLPSYVTECDWTLTHCGSFVTSKAMFDAVTAFYIGKTEHCMLYPLVLGLCEGQFRGADNKLLFRSSTMLNESQNKALEAAMSYPLTFLWGPPGTGKTQTIVVILEQLLKSLPKKKRFLVTAPTHNAVDNILQRFIDHKCPNRTGCKPLRVSTALDRVTPALRKYTCDAMMGKEILRNSSAYSKAMERVKESRLVFTTCVGSALGLLRDEAFDVVIIDEASQQTEPASLIPLTKGCSRAVLVGDHVQLRATVQKHAVIVDYDVSLFERHYTMLNMSGVGKIMLDTQYRMHSQICDFSSTNFYSGQLKTARADEQIPLAPSKFPWPGGARKVFINCPTLEDLGGQSKSNEGQVELCRRVCGLLTSAPQCLSNPATPDTAIAILTPYTKQRLLLQSAVPKIGTFSIDGFQGREADVIVFVTVRCNVHYDTGFLKDMRRLNVAMTRARAGVIIIADKATLTKPGDKDGDPESKAVWTRLLSSCAEVRLPEEAQAS